MTNEEALNILYKGIAPNPTANNECIELCKKALEKQIPQKVTHEATLYKCCTCPNCKNVVDEFTEFMGNRCRVTPIYCKYCGQALDWSDSE